MLGIHDFVNILKCNKHFQNKTKQGSSTFLELENKINSLCIHTQHQVTQDNIFRHMQFVL
jgi:hypothetical protein